MGGGGGMEFVIVVRITSLLGQFYIELGEEVDTLAKNKNKQNGKKQKNNQLDY